MDKQNPVINYGKQQITVADIESVVNVLKSSYLTQGPTVPEFELKISGKAKSNYAVAVSNATSALHLACLVVGLTKGDWLWTSANTFVSSANCAEFCGANVDFVDIDLETHNICPVKLEKKLIQAKKNASLPKVLMVVHFAGQSCDMKYLHSLSLRFGFKIIEDASHAIGANFQGEPVGSCKYSEMCIFSFHPVKIITTGEGGCITTNNVSYYKRLISLRTHGIDRLSFETEADLQGPMFYEMKELGYNYRLTDIQAALGLSQLDRLDENINKRNVMAQYYGVHLSEKIIRPKILHDSVSSFHLYVVRFETTTQRNMVFEALQKHSINTNIHYIPLHYHPFYKGKKIERSDLTNSELYYSTALTLPIYPDLSLSEQDKIISIINGVIN